MEFQAGLCKERCEFLGGALLAGQHHEHVQVEQRRGRGRAFVSDQHFGHDDATVGSHGLTDVAKDFHALVVILIVENVLEKVNTAARRNVLEETPADAFHAVVDTGLIQRGARTLDQRGAIEQDSAGGLLALQYR